MLLVITHIYFLAKFWGKLWILSRLISISNMYSFLPLKCLSHLINQYQQYFIVSECMRTHPPSRSKFRSKIELTQYLLSWTFQASPWSNWYEPNRANLSLLTDKCKEKRIDESAHTSHTLSFYGSIKFTFSAPFGISTLTLWTFTESQRSSNPPLPIKLTLHPFQWDIKCRQSLKVTKHVQS